MSVPAALSAAFPAGRAFLAPGLASPVLVVSELTGPFLAWAWPLPSEAERDQADRRQRGPGAAWTCWFPPS